MLPFLQNKIGIEASTSEPVKRKPDEGTEDNFLSDLKLAHALLGDSQDGSLAQAKNLIKSVINSLEKGNE